ncbi:MAG: cytochrome P450 [Actinocrinis sp.]
MSETPTDPAASASEPPPYFPFPTDPLSGVAPMLAERRATCPFGRVRLASGHDAVLLVTYKDVAAALADTRLSHDLTGPRAPRFTADPSLFNDPTVLANKDGEDHLRIRRIVAAAFTPRRIERWKPTIESVAGQLLDAMEAAGPCADLVADYCFPLPVRIICALLGVPERDRERFRDWSNAFISGAKLAEIDRLALIGEFAQYAAALIAERRERPGEDLIDDLIAARDGADRLSEPELLSLLLGLIAAGNETTSNALSRGLLTLLSGDGALWRQIVADPELIPAAVDELLRFNPLGPSGMMRLAVQDVELPSGTIRAGEPVMLANVSASRDDEAYQDADTVRFDRDAPAQIVFGGGPHYCLGAHLAKAELRIGLGALARRLPGLRPTADPGTLEFTGGEILSSLVSLPVAW